MANPQPPIIDDGEGEEPIRLPYKFEICSTCNGHGKNSLHLGAYTADEMDEAGPEFEEDYFAGRYDRKCDPCGGTGKVMVVDRDRTPPDLLARWDDIQRDEAEYRRMVEAERRMGA